MNEKTEVPSSGPVAPELRIGMDLITFFNADFWGLESYKALRKPGSIPPEVFWDKTLDVLESTGIEGVELTAGVGSYHSALARYGSVDQFSAALADRGLVMCSGFYPGLVYDSTGTMDSSGLLWRQPGRQKEILDEVADYADFIAGAGSQTMVMGLPLRRSWNDALPAFIDLDFASALSDLINRMGQVCLSRGVRLAMHTETRSSFWLRRDIDLFLTLTDPVYVDFCPDTAHIAMGRTNPSDVLRDHYARVSATHWKDTFGPVAKDAEITEETRASLQSMYARVGKGIIDWHEWTRTLRESQYSGWAIIELDATPDPGGQLSEARAYVETLSRRIYG